MRLAFIFRNVLMEASQLSNVSRKWLLLKIFASCQFTSKSFSLLEGKRGGEGGGSASRVEALEHEYLMVAFEPDS